MGLPFLRGAGIPLPAALTLSALDVDGGAINVRGRVTLEPIDYSELARLADELRAAKEKGGFPWVESARSSFRSGKVAADTPCCTR